MAAIHLASVLAQQIDRFHCARIMRELELDLRTRATSSDRTDLRLEQAVIEIGPLLGSHARHSRRALMAASELQHAAIGLSLALAWAIAGFRTIATVTSRMEQHGDSRDRHLVRARHEREHLPLQLQPEPRGAPFLPTGVSQHLPRIGKFVTHVEEAPALARKVLARRFHGRLAQRDSAFA